MLWDIIARRPVLFQWLSVSEKALRFIKPNVVWFQGHLEDSLKLQNSSSSAHLCQNLKIWCASSIFSNVHLSFKNLLQFKNLFVDSLTWPYLPPLVHLPAFKHRFSSCWWLFCHFETIKIEYSNSDQKNVIHIVTGKEKTMMQERWKKWERCGWLSKQKWCNMMWGEDTRNEDGLRWREISRSLGKLGSDDVQLFSQQRRKCIPSFFFLFHLFHPSIIWIQVTSHGRRGCHPE